MWRRGRCFDPHHTSALAPFCQRGDAHWKTERVIRFCSTLLGGMGHMRQMGPADVKIVMIFFFIFSPLQFASPWRCESLPEMPRRTGPSEAPSSLLLHVQEREMGSKCSASAL
jgi:hypothetical protein